MERSEHKSVAEFISNEVRNLSPRSAKRRGSRSIRNVNVKEGSELMRILGVDPGLGTTGYGAIRAQGRTFRLIEGGVVSTRRSDPLEKKLATLRRGFHQVIQSCKPEVVILEDLYSHAQHPRTAILMGHARGVLLAVCSEKALPVVNFPAKKVKKAIVGNGNATKAQIQEMVKTLLHLKETPCPADVFDALALAMSYVYLKGISR